jgi:serine/threonine protein kinase
MGVSLYQAATLRLPYEGDSDEAYIAAVSTKPPTPARSVDKSIPKDLETILIKCLERDPNQRYSTASDVAADLRRFLSDEPVVARRPSPILKAWRTAKRHKYQTLSYGVLSILLIAVSIVVFFTSPGRAPTTPTDPPGSSTLRTLRVVGQAMESYRLDWGSHPGPTEGIVPLEELRGDLDPVYLMNLPLTDEWNHPLMVWTTEDTYWLVSAGRDGVLVLSAERLKRLKNVVRTDSLDSDIVYKQGLLVQWPWELDGF